jgi:hypothetical protein
LTRSFALLPRCLALIGLPIPSPGLPSHAAIVTWPSVSARMHVSNALSNLSQTAFASALSSNSHHLTGM